MTLEEAVKTVQLKREIDSLLESRIDIESGCSSDEEFPFDDQQRLSPTSIEKLRTEKKY